MSRSPPLSFLAPSLRFGPKRSRAPAKASFTNSLLPITAPSVKYLTRQRSIFAIPRSFNTVSLSLLSNNSAVFFVSGRSFDRRLETPHARSSLPKRQPHQSPIQPRNLRPFLRIKSHALIAEIRPHQPFPRLFPVPLLPAAHRFAVAAPAVVRRIFHHPGPHRIQVDVGRHRPRRHAAFHDHALEPVLPQVPERECARLNHW
jgi:hypothetical protein